MPRGFCNTESTFWARVDKSGAPDGCWLWTGEKLPKGYGQFRINWERRLAHRWAWHFSIGPIPDGLCVCHRCDNPPCCNPAHLFLGTKADNLADMVAKGRHPKGRTKWRAKLTDDKVIRIRRFYAKGISGKALASIFNVSRSQISNVVTRQRTWIHVT